MLTINVGAHHVLFCRSRSTTDRHCSTLAVLQPAQHHSLSPRALYAAMAESDATA